MRVVRIQVGEGLGAGEAERMLGTGWRCVPKVTLDFGAPGGIVVPGKQVVGVEVVDVWYVPEPTVPAGHVIAALQAVAKWDDKELTIVSFLGKHLLGMTAREILRFGQKAVEEGDNGHH